MARHAALLLTIRGFLLAIWLLLLAVVASFACNYVWEPFAYSLSFFTNSWSSLTYCWSFIAYNGKCG